MEDRPNLDEGPKQREEGTTRGQRKRKEERRRCGSPEELEGKSDGSIRESQESEFSRKSKNLSEMQLGEDENRDDAKALVKDAYMTANDLEGVELPHGTGPFWPRVEGTAIPNSPDFEHFQPSAEKRCVVSFSRDGGFGEIVTWLEARVGCFLGWDCKTRVFPLPTSTPMLRVVFPQVPPLCFSWIRCLRLALNSLNGESLRGCKKVSPFHLKWVELCLRTWLNWVADTMS